MAEQRRGFLQSLAEGLAPNPDVLASGMVDGSTRVLTIYRDCTFTTKTALGAESQRDRLLSIEHDADSMRRKSVTGRGAAAILTGGLSIWASNNRGVVYLTVVGENSGVRTFTTRNPSGATLSAIRSLKAAGDAVIAQANASAAPAAGQTATVPSDSNVAVQLQQLADLLDAGALTPEEFSKAKARLLG